jgi:NADPH2:quinone reductase
MRAAVFTEYGPPEVLQLQDVAKPVPRDDEVLIRVRATTVTATDCLIRQGKPPWSRLILGLRRPRKRILGIELAEEVEVVGKNVRRFAKGDHRDWDAIGAWAIQLKPLLVA